MYILKLKYFIYNTENMILIKSEFDNILACAISLNNIDFHKFEKIMYEGFNDDIYKSTLEERYVLKVLEKYPHLFDSNNTEEECLIKSYIRNNLITYKESFISDGHFIKVDNFINNYKINMHKPRVALISTDRLNHLSEMLSTLPIISFESVDINLDQKNDLSSFDFIIIDKLFMSEVKGLEDLKVPVLPVDVDKYNLFIGPLVFTEKHDIPSYDHYNDRLFNIKISDQSLLFFFIERIIFIVTLKLYNEIKMDVMLPVRNILTINKKTLEGKSSHVLLYPKSHKEEMVLQ